MIQISPGYKPAPIAHKDVFGITFEQGRNEIKLNGDELFANIPTRNKNFPEAAKRDLMIALITLKYTQSISVLAWRATRPTYGIYASIRRC